jgi:membrane protease YdiL (CAAX protease family)
VRGIFGALLAGLVLVALLGALLPAPARADGDGPSAAPAPKGADEGPDSANPSMEDLEQRVMENPGRAAGFVALYAALFLAGVTFLVLRLTRRREERMGLRPISPPVEPTQPFKPWYAILYVFAAWVAGSIVGAAILLRYPSLKDSLAFQLGLTAAIEVPLALVIVLRRWRSPTRPAVGPGRAALTGLWGIAVAIAIVVPVSLLQRAAFKAFDVQPEQQTLVGEFLSPEETWQPWVIFLFGTIVAPFAEEAIFRGTLYPAVRGLLGGGRRGTWLGAIIVSAAFAAVHANLNAALPLFALAMVLTWVFHRTNSLIASTIAHASNNLLTFLLLFSLKLS